MRKKLAGFALIELLVVIAIISFLASIVLASLNTARLKAKDAAIRQAMHQMRILYESSYAEKGDYSDWQLKSFYPPPTGTQCQGFGESFTSLNWGFVCPSTNADCENMFGGSINKPSLEAQNICKNILTIGGGSTKFVMGVPQKTPRERKNYYSIMALLPSEKKCLCIGSSGTSITSETCDDYGPQNHNPLKPVGCFYNP